MITTIVPGGAQPTVHAAALDARRRAKVEAFFSAMRNGRARVSDGRAAAWWLTADVVRWWAETNGGDEAALRAACAQRGLRFLTEAEANELLATATGLTMKIAEHYAAASALSRECSALVDFALSAESARPAPIVTASASDFMACDLKAAGLAAVYAHRLWRLSGGEHQVIPLARLYGRFSGRGHELAAAGQVRVALSLFFARVTSTGPKGSVWAPLEKPDLDDAQVAMLAEIDAASGEVPAEGRISFTVADGLKDQFDGLSASILARATGLA